MAGLLLRFLGAEMEMPRNLEEVVDYVASRPIPAIDAYAWKMYNWSFSIEEFPKACASKGIEVIEDNGPDEATIDRWVTELGLKKSVFVKEPGITYRLKAKS